MAVVTFEIPDIDTERLRLRRCRLEDFEDLYSLWSEPAVYRYIGGKAMTENEVWGRFLQTAGGWAVLGFGTWALEERATGRFLGVTGFFDARRDIDASMRGVPEVGWVLAPDAHGRGFGSEAVQAALAWGDAHLEADRTVALIAPENVPSIRLAEKAGYRACGRGAIGEIPVNFYERMRRRSPA